MAIGDRQVTRRKFLKASGAAAGFALVGGGLDGFMPGPRRLEAQGLPTLEELTKGKIKSGMTITKDNVEAVKPLITPGNYEKVAKYGMEMPLFPTTTQRELVMPQKWIEVTEKNKGQAMLDKNGQLWTRDGKRWIGGSPFPEPKTGLEMMWNGGSLAWFEYSDDWKYLYTEHLISKGKIYRTFEGWFTGISMAGRVHNDPRPYYPGHEKENYRFLIVYTKPFDFRGAGFFSIFPYDQTKVEATYAYIPALRRVRQVSTTQRWESPVGDDVFFSDYNFQSDPVLNWNWKLVEKKPMIGVSISEGYQPDKVPAVAGRFPRGRWELRPEVYVVEGTPKDPTCPYSKRVFYMDSVTLKPISADLYDKQGRLWRTITYFYARTKLKGQTIISAGQPHYMDLQADHVSFVVAGNPDNINTGAKVEDFWTEKTLREIGT
jgi:hypothetical protein